MEIGETWSRGRCPCPRQRAWNQMLFKVPSNQSVLWFYDSHLLLEHVSPLALSISQLMRTAGKPASSIPPLQTKSDGLIWSSPVMLWEVSTPGDLRADQEASYPDLQVEMYQVLNWSLSCVLNWTKMPDMGVKAKPKDLAQNYCKHCLYSCALQDKYKYGLWWWISCIWGQLTTFTKVSQIKLSLATSPDLRPLTLLLSKSQPAGLKHLTWLLSTQTH